MIKKIPIVRRRKWKRFKVRTGALVKLHKQRLFEIGPPKLIDFGPIIDISMGGLSVQYVESDKRNGFDSERLTVILPAEGIKLDGMNFRIVSDFIVAKLPGGKKVRNRCVEFVNVDAHQHIQLESFIKHYAMGTLKDRRSGYERRADQEPSWSGNNADLLDRRKGKERRRSFYM